MPQLSSIVKLIAIGLITFSLSGCLATAAVVGAAAAGTYYAKN